MKCYFKYVMDNPHNQQVMLSNVDFVVRKFFITY